jgi:hypothetical protein
VAPEWAAWSADVDARLWRLPEDAPAHHLVLERLAKTAVTAACRAEVNIPVADLITHYVRSAGLPEMYRGLLEEKDRFLGVVLDWR